MKKDHLYGLNTLRFLAAFFIIAMHVQNNQVRVGLPSLPPYAFLYKGAVSFFFTLSGFLITYIRIGEYNKTGTVNLKVFFGNRFFRLSPVYYLVIIAGLIFYWVIAPMVGIPFEIKYDIGLAAILYSCFLPNIMNSLYHVGGILNVSWSIGAQEQFYFALLPFMKKRISQMPLFLWLIIGLSIAISIANAYNLFQLPPSWQSFIHTLRFHFMGIGALLGYYLRYRKERLLSLWIFSRKWMQWILAGLLVGWYAWKTDSIMVKATITFPLSFLYGWLIINVSSNPKNIIRIDNKIFDWIGQRTYGVYMFHMFIVYAVSFFFSKTGFFSTNYALYIVSFYLLVFGITIVLAHLSFTFIEKPILAWYKALRKKEKKHSREVELRLISHNSYYK